MATYKIDRDILTEVHTASYQLRMATDETLKVAFAPVATRPMAMDDTDLSVWVSDAFDAARTAYDDALATIGNIEAMISKGRIDL